MNRLLAFLLYLIFSTCAFGQLLNDVSFGQKTTDLTAKIKPVLDQNGNACALVKVIAPRLEDLKFEGNYVVKVEKQELDYYVWLANGAKKLTLRHKDYLPIEKNFDPPLEAKMTYQWMITGAEEGHSTPNVKQKTGWVIIDSQPQGASVYLNDDYVGNTPLDTYKAPYNHYTYRLELGNYHNVGGEFDLSQPKYELTIPLKPAFGSIRVTSSVDGAQVLLDGKVTGKVTPCTLEEVSSGMHHVTVQMAKYAPSQLDIEVQDGKISQASVTLNARYARVTIQSLNGAQILIDGNQKGTTNYNEDLMEGYYDVEVRLSHHRSISKQIHVEAGQPMSLSLEPIPIYGSLDVMSSPRHATVNIDGENIGFTPLSIEQLLEGEHTLFLTKEGYTRESCEVYIEANQTTSVSLTLQNGKMVSIRTDYAGDAIYVDGSLIGASPYQGILKYGEHSLYALHDGKRSSEKWIMVSDEEIPSSIKLTFFESKIKSFTVKGVTFSMMPVEGGSFQMGATSEQVSPADNEKPVHKVILSDYYIGETEVTQALWEAVMGETVSQQRDKYGYGKLVGEGSNFPMYYVSWEECQTFIQKLNLLTNQTFRLPTEAEWEYAARGGKKSRHTQFAGSRNIEEVAWHKNNSGNSAHVVKTKAANELGVYDMSGNVYEWCQGGIHQYSSSAQTNPIDERGGRYHVIRGGNWYQDADYCRTSHRNGRETKSRENYVGLRLAL